MRRESIFKAIKEKPGISYNELVRKTNLSNGVISHYLIQLIRDKEIKKYGQTRPKYFIANIEENDMKIITILRNQTNNDICKYLIQNSKNDLELRHEDRILDAEGISKMINKSRSTVSVSVRTLQKFNIVDRVIMNKKSRLTNDIGYVILNRNKWMKFLSKYKL